LIARTGAETVLSFCYRSSFINAIAKLLGAGHKCIVSERNYPSEYFSKGLRAAVVKSLIRTLYNRADIVTCNGSETKESLERDFSVRCPIHVIPNAYNREEILARSQEAIDSKDEHIFKRGKRIIIYVSRMAANKGHKDLVEAFCKLRNRSAYTLVLVGDGPCEAQLRGQVERMSLGNEVFLIGRRNNPFPYLARAEIFVMPSYYEGYPNALAEALICGLACIAYDFKAGARELLGDNEAGLLVRRGDIAELAQAIETVENRSHRARLFTTAQLCEAYGKIL
jgi:N-acetylgalactosamine-N,N'-diacetylbacillosaminyl-diphospho-undecaprenol 4-alpha-N-acetylgalactosaminyltransferase